MRKSNPKLAKAMKAYVSAKPQERPEAVRKALSDLPPVLRAVLKSRRPS
jgi:hypothetical protein